MVAPIGLVLAGGAGKRMGRAKGDLLVGGRPLALRAAQLLAPLCEGVLISVGPGRANPAPGYPVVEDAGPAGRGPLAGIDAAFAATSAADLLVLACDYPQMGSELLRALLAQAVPGDELVLPRDSAGRDHPLVALWRRVTHARVSAALRRAAFRVDAIVAGSKVRRLDPAAFPGIDLDALLVNVNRPEQLPQTAAPD